MKMRRLPSWPAILLAAVALAPACGDEDDGSIATPDAATAAPDATPLSFADASAFPDATSPDAAGELPDAQIVEAPDAGPGPDAGCARLPAAADRARKVVVSHPFAGSGQSSDVYEVLELSAGGALTATGTTFHLGVAYMGNIVFTPDGEIGLVAQDDGSVGVFRFQASGAVEVLHAKYVSTAFYAGRIVMDPSGERAYVVDPNWRENGGGIYGLRIGCDGTLTEEGLLAPSKLARYMGLVPGDSGRAVVAAHDLLDSTGTADTHLMTIGATPALVGSAAGFAAGEAIISDGAITSDGRYALIAENSAFSGLPHRLAVLEIQPGGLRRAQELSPLNDPAAVVASPFGNAALLVEFEGNALRRLRYDPTSAKSLSIVGAITYQGARPELPGSSALVERGALKGRVLIAENQGVRQVDFRADGTVQDRGLSTFGAGIGAVPGALGVQP